MKNKLDKKIFVAGHLGMVGASLVRELKKKNFRNIIVASRNDLDLENQQAVQNFFKHERPDEVYVAAARVGGIYANNTFPAEFIYENLIIALNIIKACFENKISKLLYLGSSCIYPRDANQPINEENLLKGYLEKTNEPYAIAKIAAIKLCESFNRQYGKEFNIDYRCVMPTNLFGRGDSYDDKNSHVIPALINRFHNAKIKNQEFVNVWGSGAPQREFMYVDDLASACIFLMNLDKKKYYSKLSENSVHVNVGSGYELSIKELAYLISNIVGFKGKILFDPKYPDGTPRKLVDSSIINSLGWKPKIKIEFGLKKTYKYFLEEVYKNEK